MSGAALLLALYPYTQGYISFLSAKGPQDPSIVLGEEIPPVILGWYIQGGPINDGVFHSALSIQEPRGLFLLHA